MKYLISIITLLLLINCKNQIILNKVKDITIKTTIGKRFNYASSFIEDNQFYYYYSDFNSKKQIEVFNSEFNLIKKIDLKEYISKYGDIRNISMVTLNKIIVLNKQSNSINIINAKSQILNEINLPSEFSYEKCRIFSSCFNGLNYDNNSILLKLSWEIIEDDNETDNEHIRRYYSTNWSNNYLLKINNINSSIPQFKQNFKLNKKLSNIPTNEYFEYPKYFKQKNKTIISSFYSNNVYILDSLLNLTDEFEVRSSPNIVIGIPLTNLNNENNSQQLNYTESLKKYNYIDRVTIIDNNYYVIVKLAKQQSFHQDWKIIVYNEQKEKISETFFNGEDYEPFILNSENSILIKKTNSDEVFSIFSIN